MLVEFILNGSQKHACSYILEIILKFVSHTDFGLWSSNIKMDSCIRRIEVYKN